MSINKTGSALALALVLLLVILSGCGSEHSSTTDHAAGETQASAARMTRGQWLTMLAEAFGLDTYVSENPYYSDIQPGSSLFPYIQAASEWGILSIFADNTFNADMEITSEEVAYTAAIAAGYTGDDPARFAADSGIIQSGAAQADVVSVSEGVSALEAARLQAFPLGRLWLRLCAKWQKVRL